MLTAPGEICATGLALMPNYEWIVIRDNLTNAPNIRARQFRESPDVSATRTRVHAYNVTLVSKALQSGIGIDVV